MSGSRVDLPDEELVKEWPYLTRQQLEEYKDAFRIFDRHGQGSFTGTDVEWVMRSLGQTPTPKQIEAIIRDMDLDNDGVIDLAEFMIRMMALTTKVSLVAIHTQAYCETFHNGSQLFGECCDCLKMPKEFRPQAAPEEDLKHVFDVLDRGSNGQITADALRSAIKSIGDWEMTDDEIDIAIKLADRSGDGIIDYDEFIAFVFGDNDTARQKPQAAAPQPVASTTHAELTEVKTSDWVDPTASQSVQQHSYIYEPSAASDATQRQTAAASSAPPWLVPSDAGPDTFNVQTDDWVTAQTHGTAMPVQVGSHQPHSLYSNALYTTDAASAQPHFDLPKQSWQQQQHQQQPSQWQQLQPEADADSVDMQHSNPDGAGLANEITAASSLQAELPASDDQHWQGRLITPDVVHAQQPCSSADDERGKLHADSLAEQAPAASTNDLAVAHASTMQQHEEQQLQHIQMTSQAGCLEEQSQCHSHMHGAEAEVYQTAGLGTGHMQPQAEDDASSQPQAASPVKLLTKLPPLPKGKSPGSGPRHSLPLLPPNKRQLPALSSSQLSAGINRAKQQQN